MDTTPPRMLHIDTLELSVPTGGIPQVTAIVGLRLITGTRPAVIFPAALLGYLLWALPCSSTRTHMTVVFLTFSVQAQGGGGYTSATNHM